MDCRSSADPIQVMHVLPVTCLIFLSACHYYIKSLIALDVFSPAKGVLFPIKVCTVCVDSLFCLSLISIHCKGHWLLSANIRHGAWGPAIEMLL